MLTLEQVTEEQAYIIREILRSNPDYCGKETIKIPQGDEELWEVFCCHDSKHHTYFIKADDTYIGLLQYLEHSKREGYLSLFMIHCDYQGYGYGTNAYYLFEHTLQQQGFTCLRLSVAEQQERIKAFWQRVGFSYIDKNTSMTNVNVDYYEKTIAEEQL